MRKVTIVRLGIVAAIAAIGVVGAVASGCSGDDNNPVTGNDGGTGNDGSTGTTGTTGMDGSTGTTGHDGGGNDGSVDAAPPNPAELVLVHAAPYVPPARFCFATVNASDAGTIVPIAPAPDTPNPVTPGNIPAIVNGTIGAFSPSSGAELKTLTIRPYLITNIAAIAGDVNADGGVGVGPDGGAEETCSQLVGAKGRLSATGVDGGPPDYWQLNDIPSGTLQDNGAYLLSLVGCLPGLDPTAGAAKCGSDYNPATGNVKVTYTALDTTTAAPDGGIGIQFTNLSSALQGEPFVVPNPDGGAPLPIHGPASAGVIPGIVLPPTTDGGSPTFSPFGATPVSFDGTKVSALVAVSIDPAALSTATLGQLPIIAAVTEPPTDDAGSQGVPYPGRTVVIDDAGDTTFVPGDLIGLPFSTVQSLSRWDLSTADASTPKNFAAGQNYTFALVGDPQAPPLAIIGDAGTPVQNPAYDGRGLHFVAFPNKFAMPGQ